ncbi:AKT-interacting protein [Dirofilaria immitis]
MKRKNSLFLSSGSGFGDAEGVEIATEMSPGEPLRFSPELITEHIILSEYAMVCRDPIDGLYAVPSARNKFEWFGLLFIRRGVYAGAVFRFTLRLPMDFPSTELPKVIFNLDVFHPHVNPATRELDLKKYFVDGWKSDQHHVYHILLIVQRTFFTFDSNPATCANTEAAALLRDNRELYRMRASELIKKSRSVIYDPIDVDDANIIKLIPWDASVHEPLRQRLIGGLTDSQMSTMSMLGSLGYGLNRSSIFESRSKHGFSWISPADLCYMVEPPRPAELDLKIISGAKNSPKNAGSSHASYTDELNSRNITNEVTIPHTSGLHLNDENEQENENKSQKEYKNNDSSLQKDAMANEGDIEDLIVRNIEKTSSLMEELHEERENKGQKADVEQFSDLEKSAHRRDEYMKIQRDDHVLDANVGQARSNWSSDEIGESNI